MLSVFAHATNGPGLCVVVMSKGEKCQVLYITTARRKDTKKGADLG